MKHKAKLNGVYLVIDPAREEDTVLHQLRKAVVSTITAVQIWNNWRDYNGAVSFTIKVINICRPLNIPVIINNDVSLMRETHADGIHFDDTTSAILSLTELSNADIKGLTCGNDPQTFRWAAEHMFDYISFCSMFPSSNAGTCDLINPDLIREASMVCDMPVFISGGVTPANMLQLPAEVLFSGVAVISEIMNAVEPAARIKEYLNSLKQRNNDT